MIILCLSILLVLGNANVCHYSCLTCTGPEYVSCLSCPGGAFAETVEDPSVMPSKYWSSVYPSGTCVSTVAPSSNALGIIFLIVIVGVCLFFRTKESFYLLLTFQTYGLYNLVEIAWLNPLGYVLQGLQYLMVFNTMGYGYKEADYILIASKNYRLSKYLQTTSIAQNIPIIAAFTLVPLVILIVISVISCRRARKPKTQDKKREQIMFEAIAAKSEQSKRGIEMEESQVDDNKDQTCYCWKRFSEEVLIKIAKFLLCFLFLMVQETCLVLLVTLVYQTPVSKGILALCIIYLHILVFVMTYSYYYRIEYFREKKIMYLTFAQKIIMPVMVVVPIQYQYVFFIFAVVFLILEFIFDKMNDLYSSFNRLALYKVIEMVTVLLLLVYYFVERKGMSMSSSKAGAIAGTFVMALNLFIFMAVELPISIKEKYFPSKKFKDEMVSEKQVEKLIQEDTIDNIDRDEHDKNKMNVVILENNHDSDSDGEDSKAHKNGKENKTGDGNSELGNKNGQAENINVIRVRPSQERRQRERKEQEKLEKEMIERQKRERERREKERKEKERKEKERLEKERLEKERLEKERLVREKEQAEEAERQAERKRKRKQIIDPELRLRYGI